MPEQDELFIKRKTQAEKEYLVMRRKAQKIHEMIAQGLLKDPQFDWRQLWQQEESERISRIWKTRINEKPEE